MNFVELNLKPVQNENKDGGFVPIMLNINFISCIAPFKGDTDYSVIKCGEKTAYICEQPYDELKRILKEETISAVNKNKWTSSQEWGWI